MSKNEDSSVLQAGLNPENAEGERNYIRSVSKLHKQNELKGENMEV